MRRAAVVPKLEPFWLTGTERMLLADDAVAIVEMARERVERVACEIVTRTSSVQALG
jgi:hypothetical protein